MIKIFCEKSIVGSTLLVLIAVASNATKACVIEIKLVIFHTVIITYALIYSAQFFFCALCFFMAQSEWEDRQLTKGLPGIWFWQEWCWFAFI